MRVAAASDGRLTQSRKGAKIRKNVLSDFCVFTPLREDAVFRRPGRRSGDGLTRSRFHRTIDAMSDKVQTILAELRRKFEALYGDRLVRMILYGSQARGDAEPGSDIDVLVVLKGPVEAGEEIQRTSHDVCQLSYEYEETLSCVFMDERYFTTRNGPLLRNIRREGVPL